MREVTDMIPATIIFTHDSHWEAVKLKQPYNPADSNKDVERWYR